MFKHSNMISTLREGWNANCENSKEIVCLNHGVDGQLLSENKSLIENESDM